MIYRINLIIMIKKVLKILKNCHSELVSESIFQL
jgi:hypothetical protein